LISSVLSYGAQVWAFHGYTNTLLKPFEVVQNEIARRVLGINRNSVLAEFMLQELGWTSISLQITNHYIMFISHLVSVEEGHLAGDVFKTTHARYMNQLKNQRLNARERVAISPKKYHSYRGAPPPIITAPVITPILPPKALSFYTHYDDVVMEYNRRMIDPKYLPSWKKDRLEWANERARHKLPTLEHVMQLDTTKVNVYKEVSRELESLDRDVAIHKMIVSPDGSRELDHYTMKTMNKIYPESVIDSPALYLSYGLVKYHTMARSGQCLEDLEAHIVPKGVKPIPRDIRFCKLCTSRKIGGVEHFLCECDALKRYRVDMLNAIKTICYSTEYDVDGRKYYEILACDENTQRMTVLLGGKLAHGDKQRLIDSLSFELRYRVHSVIETYLKSMFLLRDKELKKKEQEEK